MEQSLYIDLPKYAYLPGEIIRGSILWALDKSPETVRLSFGWWTEGRGSEDSYVVNELEWNTHDTAGNETFEFTVPEAPYSFSGHLITLKWGLELSVKKGRDSSLQDITIGLSEIPVQLPYIDEG